MQIVKNKPLPPKHSGSLIVWYSSQMCVGDCVVGSRKDIQLLSGRFRRLGIEHATRTLGTMDDYGNATHGIWKLSVGEK
jgi:hypothetical protein